jgi:type I restriction enzyme S subunit
MEFEGVPFGSLFACSQRNGLTRPKKVRGSGLPMVNMGELFAHPRINHVEMDLVPVSESESDFLLEPGDLLFARQSLVRAGAGQCSLFVGNSLPTVFESHLIRCRLDTRRTVPDFYFYFFRSPQGRVAMDAIIEQGAGAAGIRGSDLVRIEVPAPRLAYQRWAVDVLRALDDRIDLLRQTNATLEAIAQALFKSWFIDFDPVRAKAEGREPEGMDAATAALFPAEFEESALGMIPKGWRVAALSELCESIFSGGTPDTRKPEYWNGDLPWFSSGETRETVIVGTEKHITAAGVANSSTRLARPGDVLIASAGQGLTRGQASYCAIDTYLNQSVVCIRTARDRAHAAWTFYNLARRYDELRGLSDSHSIRGSLTTKLLASLRLLFPPTKLTERFGEVAEPLLAAQAENRRRVASLAQLRDTLLPRLISGKLRLPEARELIEDAAA